MNVGIREYLLVINFPDTINRDIMKFKKEYNNRFGSAHYLYSKPHISLCHFFIESLPEAKFQNELLEFFCNWKKFEVVISGFDKFDGSRTLFLNPSDNEIIKTHNYLRTILRKRLQIAKKFTQRMGKPHITIASNIPRNRFDESWNYFKGVLYNKRFCADRITVLRKNLSLKESEYKIAFEVPFG